MASQEKWWVVAENLRKRSRPLAYARGYHAGMGIMRRGWESCDKVAPRVSKGTSYLIASNSNSITLPRIT